MNPKTINLIYYISTGLITALMLMSVGMYFFNTAEVSPVFESLGYPTYLIYPLGVAKLLGLIALWANVPPGLKEWAYAGFFFDFVLASYAHFKVGDGDHFPALAAAVVLLISYYCYKRR